MKFCKYLNRVISFSNPEWGPFWMNYKRMKGIINSIPSFVLKNSTDKDTWNAIRKNPYEVQFFKQLHAEVKKVSSFFAEAKAELKIRHSRIKTGLEILNKSESKTMKQNWTAIERSIYTLHSNLLLLETFAIINYCAFSKILKKHDKKTGYDTKIAFMRNVVNTSNFASYPDMIAMIQECEVLYGKHAQHAGRKDNKNLREEAHLFLGMIEKINTQELDEKDNDKSMNNGRTKKNKAVLKTNPIVSNTPNEMESLLRNLLEAKRFRSVSENRVIDSSSTVDGGEGNYNETDAPSLVSENPLSDFSTVDGKSHDHDTDAPPDYTNRKHYICLTACQHSKKQRWV